MIRIGRSLHVKFNHGGICTPTHRQNLHSLPYSLKTASLSTLANLLIPTKYASLDSLLELSGFSR